LTKLRLAIVSTHPIQYYAPLFRALASNQDVVPCVFYTWSQSAAGRQFDPGFGGSVQWDIPLLDGYQYEFVDNVAKRPSSSHFRGIVNPSLISTIESWGAEAILIYGWSLSSHLRAMRHFKGKIPVFFRGDSTLLDHNSIWRNALRRAFLTWVYRHVDVAFAVGRNSADYFRWCGVPESRVVLAPHSVDNERFTDLSGASDAQAALWREQLGIPTHALVLLFAAKFISKKDPLLLLDAFFGTADDVHLVFVGSGPLESELRGRAAGRNNIHFMPMQNQRAMPAVYRLGDVFVLPSRSETWGLAMNEAMASGRCVIAGSKVGGARDLIDPGTNGWVFESGQRDDLRRALRLARTVGSAALRRMGLAARLSIADWSTDVAAKKIAESLTRFRRPGQVAPYRRRGPRAS